MTEGTVQLPSTAGNTGPQVDIYQAAGAQGVRQAVVLADPSTGANVANVRAASSSPATSVDAAAVVVLRPDSIVITGTPVGPAAFAAAHITVSSSQTQLGAARAGAPGTGRVSITLKNNGAEPVSLGNAGVSFMGGASFTLQPGDSITRNTTAAIYGICNTGQTTIVDVWEEF